MSDDNNTIDLDDDESIIELEADNGEKVKFELLDYITFKDNDYVVLYPVIEDDGSAVILKVVHEKEELESYVPVESEEDLYAVFDLFKERNAELFEAEN